jgi:ATP-dependent Clp protease ATP-binding subunit ClpB
LSLLRRVHSLKYLRLAIWDHGCPQRIAVRILEKAGVDWGTLNQMMQAWITAQPKLSSLPDNVYLGKDFNSVLDQTDALKSIYDDSYVAIKHLLLALASASSEKLKYVAQAILDSQNYPAKLPVLV